MDAQLEKHFSTWTPRLAKALADAIDHNAPEFDEPITAAGIAAADSNLAFFFTVVTASEQEAIRTKYREKYPEALEHGDLTWSPNEWSIQLESADDADEILWELGREFEDRHREFFADVDRDDMDAIMERGQEWDRQSLEALVTALGSQEVRDAFARHGSNPLLMIMDTDGEDNGWETFQQLNTGRDDADFHAAKDYWESDL